MNAMNAIIAAGVLGFALPIAIRLFKAWRVNRKQQAQIIDFTKRHKEIVKQLNKSEIERVKAIANKKIDEAEEDFIKVPAISLEEYLRQKGRPKR